MFEDPFQQTVDSPIAPAEHCFAITPSDSDDLARATKGIYVGTGGDVVLQSIRGGVQVTFRNVSSGAVLDVRARRIFATGTTASDIVGLS